MGAAGALEAETVVEAAADWAAWMRQGETLAQEATTIFCDRERRKDSRLSAPSGLRTKSTAPAASASKTRRFRLDTRITGSGCSGRSCRKKSIPLVPGISTSSVITSGWRRRIFVFASRALMAYPTTSMLGYAARPLVRNARATAELSTTRTRIFFC